MFKKYVVITICLFFILSLTASVIKNKSRNLEKDILKLSKEIFYLEKNLEEAEIDFVYLSSPENLIKKIENLNDTKYVNYDHSKVFFSIQHFLDKKSKGLKVADNKTK